MSKYRICCPVLLVEAAWSYRLVPSWRDSKEETWDGSTYPGYYFIYIHYSQRPLLLEFNSKIPWSNFRKILKIGVFIICVIISLVPRILASQNRLQSLYDELFNIDRFIDISISLWFIHSLQYRRCFTLISLTSSCYQKCEFFYVFENKNRRVLCVCSHGSQH
jgi:hypothetical protein